MMLELARKIAECFNIEEKQIIDMLLNHSEKLDHLIE